MVFAALVFEYMNLRDALQSVDRCMAPGATLVAVLQLASAESAPVTATQYKSLELLAPLMRLVSPAEFSGNSAGVDLRELRSDTIALQRGKSFFVGYYQKGHRLGHLKRTGEAVAVGNYSCTLDALTLKPSDFCNVGVN